MKKFDTLLRTKISKRKFKDTIEKIYKEGFFSGSTDYSSLENIYINILKEANKKKKFNEDLITLWGMLEMRSFIDFQLGNTTNLYLVNCSKLVPVKNLNNYDFLPEQVRKTTLLDIKYIKHFKLEGISFENTYIATFEIMDNKEEYRPYVLLFTKNENNELIQFAFGYDSNDNNKVELFIPSFNYPVFLDSKGIIGTSLTNKYEKLSIYDYISDLDIKKIRKNSAKIQIQ